jgi:vanillate O-demethylase ferredoxin subunit
MRSAPEFLSARVRSACDIAVDVRLITLVPETGFCRAMPGAHVDVQVTVGGLTRMRSYSVVDDADGAWTIAVRRLKDSRGGSRFMCALQTGDTLPVTRPESHFDLSPSGPEYLLIAGGIGITPLLGMARSLAGRASVRLFYAGRSRAHLPFLDELAAVLGGRLEVFAADEGRRLDLAQAFAGLHARGSPHRLGRLRPAGGAVAVRDVRLRRAVGGRGVSRPCQGSRRQRGRAA